MSGNGTDALVAGLLDLAARRVVGAERMRGDGVRENVLAALSEMEGGE